MTAMPLRPERKAAMRGGAITSTNFGLSAEHVALLDQMTRAARAEFAGDSERMDKDKWWPEDGFKRLAKLGIALDARASAERSYLFRAGEVRLSGLDDGLDVRDQMSPEPS